MFLSEDCWGELFGLKFTKFNFGWGSAPKPTGKLPELLRLPDYEKGEEGQKTGSGCTGGRNCKDRGAGMTNEGRKVGIATPLDLGQGFSRAALHKTVQF